MLVKELKKVLEGLDESKEIVFNICDGEKVVSSGGEFLELINLEECGYMLEVLDEDGYKNEEEGDDEEDMDDES